CLSLYGFGCRQRYHLLSSVQFVLQLPLSLLWDHKRFAFYWGFLIPRLRSNLSHNLWCHGSILGVLSFPGYRVDRLRSAHVLGCKAGVFASISSSVGFLRILDCLRLAFASALIRSRSTARSNFFWAFSASRSTLAFILLISFCSDFCFFLASLSSFDCVLIQVFTSPRRVTS